MSMLANNEDRQHEHFLFLLNYKLLFNKDLEVRNYSDFEVDLRDIIEVLL